MGKRICAVLALMCLVAAGCSDEIESPSGVSLLENLPDTPRGLAVSIGDTRLTLSWTINDPSGIDHYVVYFSDTGDDDMSYLDDADDTVYTAEGLVNGKIYYFRVAAVGTNGIEGEMSLSETAKPGVFSIAINTGSTYTKSRSVTINLTAPQGTGLVQLSEDASFAGVYWQDFAIAKQFELSDGDGVKQVCARFQMTAGGNSEGYVVDSIILDRLVAIRLVTAEAILETPVADTVLTAGDVVRFAVYVDSSETGGEASVNVDGLGEIELQEIGIIDSLAEYATEYVIPVGTELTDAEVTGYFTDAAGNEAPSIKSSSRLTATFPPDPVILSGFALSSSEIQLEWTKSAISDFACYRLFRSNPFGGPSLIPVTAIESQATIMYRDTGLVDETVYSYWLYVVDDYGNEAVSNQVNITTLENEPPEATTIAASVTGDSVKTVKLTWLQADEADFKAYHILRNNGPISVYDETKLISLISTRGTVSYTDELADPGTYYYRVFVFDKQGASTGSNTVSVVVP